MKLGKYVPNYRKPFVGRPGGYTRYGRFQGQFHSLRGRGRASARYQPYNKPWSQAQLGYGGPYGQFGYQHQNRKKALAPVANASNPASVPNNLNNYGESWSGE